MAQSGLKWVFIGHPYYRQPIRPVYDAARGSIGAAVSVCIDATYTFAAAVSATISIGYDKLAAINILIGIRTAQQEAVDGPVRS